MDQKSVATQKSRTYALCALVLEKNPELPLDEEEFKRIKQARACLSAALALEESYDLLLANYREFELEVLSIAVVNMTSMKGEYEDFFDIGAALNRRLINLLSTCRMYLDRCWQHVEEIGADSEMVKQVASNSYDNFFEYRFMEALRNHAQHAGLAVHSVTAGGRWLPAYKPTQLQFYVTPYALKAVLQENQKFKKKILNECPDKVALVPAVRVYVGGISSVHQKVRDIIAPFVADGRALFEEVMARHEAIAEERYVGLAALAKDGDEIVDRVPVILKWDDVRLKLMNNNQPIENISQRFVTSQNEEGAS